MKGLTDESTLRAAELDEKYFGEVTLERSVEVINSQASSMLPGSTKTNVYEQAGDLLFALVSLARNQNWNLERLLQDATNKVERRRSSRHYYEAHVTVEPVFEERLEEFKIICHDYKFRVANLLMQKRKSDTEERSKNDSFCTGRGISDTDMEKRMMKLVNRLEKEGFKVWRYKIESTLLDSRYDDSKRPLDKQSLPEKEKDPKPPADGALSGRVCDHNWVMDGHNAGDPICSKCYARE
jgi:NTP pyrophosphatase (non-canonical NTP hydrolase)